MKSTRVPVLLVVVVLALLCLNESVGDAAVQEKQPGFTIIGQLGESAIEETKRFPELLRHDIGYFADPTDKMGYEVEFLDAGRVQLRLPGTTRDDAKKIWKRLSNRVEFSFRIVANYNRHPLLIETAKKTAKDKQGNVFADVAKEPESKPRDESKPKGETKPIGQWVVLGRDRLEENDKGPAFFKFTPMEGNLLRNHQTGELIDFDYSSLTGDHEGQRKTFSDWCKENGHDEVDILVCIPIRERHEVNGTHILSVQKGVSENANPRIEFRLKPAGAKRMFSLTSANRPSAGSYCFLGLILDGELVFAPRLNAPIRGEGVIEGNFSNSEIEWIAAVLNSQRHEIFLKPDWLSIEEIK